MVKYITKSIKNNRFGENVWDRLSVHVYNIPGGLTNRQTKHGSHCERAFHRKTYHMAPKTPEKELRHCSVQGNAN